MWPAVATAAGAVVSGFVVAISAAAFAADVVAIAM